MFGIEPYILFASSILILIGIVLTYYAYDYYQIAIIAFAISTVSAAFFYENIPVWNISETEAGIGSYLRGGLLLFSGTMGLFQFLRGVRIHKFKISINIFSKPLTSNWLNV